MVACRYNKSDEDDLSESDRGDAGIDDLSETDIDIQKAVAGCKTSPYL